MHAYATIEKRILFRAAFSVNNSSCCYGNSAHSESFYMGRFLDYDQLGILATSHNLDRCGCEQFKISTQSWVLASENVILHKQVGVCIYVHEWLEITAGGKGE